MQKIAPTVLDSGRGTEQQITMASGNLKAAQRAISSFELLQGMR
jgi:hypothetical protein